MNSGKLQNENAQQPTCSLETIQEFQSWRRKIKPLFQLLGKTPSTDLEIEVCSEQDNLTVDNSLLKDSALSSNCQKLFEDLTQKVNQQKIETIDLWNNIQSQWKELEEKEEFQLGFTYAETGIIKAIQDLNFQLTLRKVSKQRSIATFIGELRKEISDIWGKCMITQEEKESFKEFHLYEFNEEMLDIHYEELKKWKIYHKKNQEILEKINTREEMWTTLKDLEARADDPNRFVNRGGTLLKDQSTHAYIMKNLPKLETELMKMAENFEKEHGRQMKIYGQKIPEMIEESWATFKADKAAKKLTRSVFNNNISGSLTSNPTVPLRARHSIMPIPSQSSSVKAGDKRQATKYGSQSPLKKLSRLASSSTESIVGSRNN